MEVYTMAETFENPEKARMPVWSLILMPVLLAAAFYFGMKTSAGNDPAAAQGNNSADAQAHDAADPGTITLTEQAKINIGLTTAEADLRIIEQVTRVPGTVRAHPNRVAYVNTRIEGRVENLFANLGDRVAKGQKLAEVQSRRYGNPIPLVSVTAPITGTVVERNVSLGASVDPSMPLFKIMDLSMVIVEGEVFEDYVPSLKMQQRARIHLNAYPDEIFEGKIVFISSVLDSEKRSAQIWVLVNNQHGKLKPEMFSEVAIVVGANPEAIAVPVEAVVEDGPNKFVFVENGAIIQKVDVVTGLSDDVYVEIVDGLYPGDVVVTDGNHQLLAVSTRPQAGGVQDESKPHSH
jgi:multidrug efflux pump subunit AcrA (membrane-fusion protein)